MEEKLEQARRRSRQLEEASRLAAGAGKSAAAADPDVELCRRLALVDREGLPMPPRLTAAQNAALTRYLLELAAEEDLDATMQMLRGLLYGFQLGHDYVQKFGRLG